MRSKIKHPGGDSPKSPPHKIIYCELYTHQKHTAVCVNLRAKGICKRNCKPFFDWAKLNDGVVDETLKKYRKPIERFLYDNKIVTDDLKARVIPTGDHMCRFCSRLFQHSSRLQNHERRKHARELNR